VYITIKNTIIGVMKEKDYTVLLEISTALAKAKTRLELLQLVFDRVGSIFKFDCPGLFIIDPQEEYHIELTDANCVMDPINRYVYEHMDSNKYSHPNTAIAFWSKLPVPQIFDLKQLHEEVASHPHFPHMLAAGLKSVIAGALTHEGKAIGTLCLSSTDANAYAVNDIVRFNALCDQLAIAVHNILSKEHIERKEKEKTTQLKLVKVFYEEKTWENRLLKTGKILSDLIPFDVVAFNMLGERFTHVNFGIQRIGATEFRAITLQKFLEIAKLTETDFALYMATNKEEEPTIQHRETYLGDADKYKAKQKIVDVFDTSSSLTIPFKIDGEDFSVAFFSRADKQYNNGHIHLFEAIKATFVLSMEKALLYEEVSRLNVILSEEKKYLKEQVDKEFQSSELIGECLPMKQVYEKIKLVANADTSILLLGETGSGKEVVAGTIHSSSNRCGHPLIKVNCASLPRELIESELFGHEKGAFTGALRQRIGKFELAHGGTLFLDEIGEMPLALQPKLLRVIQEKEFERLGGQKTIKVDVRIIAATNRDLEKAVEDGNFRGDLFYRLSVFPIVLPPLRTRGMDIDLLTQYFVDKHCRKLRKRCLAVSGNTKKALSEYQWPGNIRELSNIIERSVLLSTGNELELAWNENLKGQGIANNFEFKTLQESETAVLLETLIRCNGKIRGQGGAAEKLDVPPSTLEYRIKRAGITKKDIYSA